VCVNYSLQATLHPVTTLPIPFGLADCGVLSQAVHEDTVRLSMGTIIQQGPRIAER